MLILIGALLALIPAFAILYPLLRGSRGVDLPEDESSPHAELARRWDSAVAGLKNTELEAAIGNLEEEDYRWLREQYMTEAAEVMKGMELEEEQEQHLLMTIEREVQQARLRTLGPGDRHGYGRCAHCLAEVPSSRKVCPECGRPFRSAEQGTAPTPEAPDEAAGE